MSITAMKQALEALEKLWNIIDDIDTYGDMAKADDKLYRSLVERRQRQRFETTGISTDGYKLSGGAITALRTAIAEADRKKPVAWATDLHFDADTEIIPAKQKGRLGTDGMPVPLFSGPTAAQRQWVGLTEAEINEWDYDTRDVVMDIEKLLREKNT